MNLLHWFRRREQSDDPQTNPKLQFLAPRARFLKIVDGERMRADRSNSEFALVVFRFPDSETRPDGLQRFAAALRLRLRATDHAGFCGNDGRDIGVVLWEGSAMGVSIFLNSLSELLRQRHFEQGELPAYDVYLYPTDPPYTDDDDASGSTSDKPKIDRDTLHEPLPQVKSVEALFVQPLPGWKRALDIAGASLGIIVLSPLLLLTAALIKLTSRGPVFFRQTCDGLGGRRFTILKFRTMRIDAEERKAALPAHSEQVGPASGMKHDPRITPLGRYLRKTCLDELPQLWNVLKGDMTLVGPRPLDSREAAQITRWGRRRSEVTPGLTCTWQVDGKSRLSFAEWMRMDIRYIKSRSFFQDVNLIWRTAVSVALHRASVCRGND